MAILPRRFSYIVLLRPARYHPDGNYVRQYTCHSEQREESPGRANPTLYIYNHSIRINERRRVYKKPAAFWQGSYYYCPAIVCISFNHIRLIASASFSPSNLCPMSLGCNPSAKFSFPPGVLGLRSPSFQKSTDFRPHFSATTFSAS